MAKAEYGRAVYCDTITSGPLQGGGEEEGVTDGDAVLGTGVNSPGRGKVDGGGGGGGKGWYGGIKGGGVKTEYPQRWDNRNG